MNRKEFFNLARKSLRMEKEDLDQLQWAYWLAKNAHRNQKRDCGERYFEHCRRVAVSFIKHWKNAADCENCADYDLIHYENAIVALLHDCIEDCFLPQRFIDKLFHSGVARSVETLSKIKVLEDARTWEIRKTKKPDEVYYGQIYKADIGIRIIKCLDRLDNIRDFRGWSKNRIHKYIAETEKYILPIAKATDEKLFEALKTEIEKIKKKA